MTGTAPTRLGLAVLLAMAATMSPPAVGMLPAQAHTVVEAIPDIILFTHVTCPYCTDAKRYVEALQRRTPGLTVRVRELTRDRRASADLQEFARQAGVRSPGVPAWVIGGRVFFVGFGGAAVTGRQIERILADLNLPKAPDPGEP